MAITGVSSSGLISGLDVDDLVGKIMEVEQKPVTLLTLRQNEYELEVSAVLSLSSKLSAYKSALEGLNDIEKFNTKSASVTQTSSGVDLMSVSASSTASEGIYSVQVNQLATSSKKGSQGWADKTSTAIASSSGTFKFKVGSSGAVTSVGYTSTTTLKELMDAINTADGGVTASIVHDGTGSNPYRLVLSADNTGASNNIIITQNNTDLDFTNKKVEAAYAYSSNSYSGTVASNSGNNYTGTENKTFLIKIVSAGESGTATYKYSVDGGITWLGYGGVAYDSTASDDTSGGAITTSTSLKAVDGAGSTNEGVQASFSSGSTLAVGDMFSIDVFNPAMQSAQDAVITVDNATIVKSTNTIDDAIQGVTMDLLQADSSSTVTLKVSSSSDDAKEAIDEFVSSYNELFEFINEQLSYDPEEGQANPLLGDPTLLEIRRRVADAVTGTIPGLSTSSYTNLSQIGISSDYKTGMLSVDYGTLNSALSSKPDDVAKLFVGTAVPTNQSITYEGKSSDTQAGNYGIFISRAPEQATIIGDNDLSTTGLGSDETLTIKYSTNYTDSNATFTAFSATLTAGSTINTIVNTLNSTFATNDAPFTASNYNGKLKITSDDYGSDIWFQVTTNQGSDTDNDQIWDSASDDTISDQGVDIAGSINNHLATGEGNVLTATASGFPEEGLKISTTSSQTGLFGTIRVSLGIADLLPTILDSYVNEDTGVLKSKESSLQDSIDSLQDRIERLEERLQNREERLREEFARLETVLQQYDALSQYLANNLTALPVIGK